MKTKKLFVTLLASVIMLLLASCNCKVCSKEGYKATVCRDKYDTTQEFENDITFMEGEGYNCE